MERRRKKNCPDAQIEERASVFEVEGRSGLEAVVGVDDGADGAGGQRRTGLGVSRGRC